MDERTRFTAVCWAGALACLSVVALGVCWATGTPPPAELRDALAGAVLVFLALAPPPPGPQRPDRRDDPPAGETAGPATLRLHRPDSETPAKGA